VNLLPTHPAILRAIIYNPLYITNLFLFFADEEGRSEHKFTDEKDSSLRAGLKSPSPALDEIDDLVRSCNPPANGRRTTSAWSLPPAPFMTIRFAEYRSAMFLASAACSAYR